EARMQAERNARRVGADLQHLPGRDRQRRTAARVERIVVRDHHAERVVAAAQVQHHEVAAAPLRPHEIREELGRGKRHGERRDAAFDELPSGDFHISWYSGDPAIRCTSPTAFDWTWAVTLSRRPSRADTSGTRPSSRWPSAP